MLSPLGVTPAWRAASRMVSTGIRKLNPWTICSPCSEVNVAAPMTCPRSSKTGPPLLPWMMAASVWITRWPPMSSLKPETRPVVIEGSYWVARLSSSCEVTTPGNPMTNSAWPRWRSVLCRASRTTGSSRFSILRMATSRPYCFRGAPEASAVVPTTT